MPTLLITYPQEARGRSVVAELLDGAADPVWLADLDGPARAVALRAATAVLARNTDTDLLPGEAALLANAKLVQFVTAGVDFVHLNALPPDTPIASNGGAYAESMAEHGLAMALAAAKRLLIEHAALGRGEFNQHTRNRMLAGAVCGILGFGGIGIATARLMRAIGMQVYAINRRGSSEEPTDWIGSTDQLDRLLTASDVLMVCTPLTPRTQGMMGARELGLMKDNAILVNLARGEIVDEAALFAHLRSHPKFFACIDAWWVEPVRHGAFRMDQPFLSLPNVIGSPHNSASSSGAAELGLRRALANVRRVLTGGMPLHLVGPEDRMM